ncbi:hypothetical protein HRG84_02585 [Flavisolibacter sp. BT320]|nr:hypothetical protein [Flavisolibacter longurius]
MIQYSIGLSDIAGKPVPGGDQQQVYFAFVLFQVDEELFKLGPVEVFGRMVFAVKSNHLDAFSCAVGGEFIGLNVEAIAFGLFVGTHPCHQDCAFHLCFDLVMTYCLFVIWVEHWLLLIIVFPFFEGLHR